MNTISARIASFGRRPPIAPSTNATAKSASAVGGLSREEAADLMRSSALGLLRAALAEEARDDRT